MGWRELRRDVSFAAGLLRQRPFQVLLQITNRCNMKCDFCDFWPHGVPREEELSLDDYRRLEEELSQLGTFLVSIEGGEPFLREDLVEVVRVFSRRHITALYTNGWFVDDTAARSLFEAGLAQVGVSIDYPDAERHDRRRVTPGAFDRAWCAVDACREAAPYAGRQIHVMTVLMDDNWRDMEALLEASAKRKVAHSMTLYSPSGFRRADGGELPSARVSEHLLALWKRFPHLKIFREYLGQIDSFLDGGAMPTCRAGVQSFNIDHVGNVAPCIEKIDAAVGNVRKESLETLHSRIRNLSEVRGCQDCWTTCRGFNQLLGGGPSFRSIRDLSLRMRSS